jgi:hypothetical protein
MGQILWAPEGKLVPHEAGILAPMLFTQTLQEFTYARIPKSLADCFVSLSLQFGFDRPGIHVAAGPRNGIGSPSDFVDLVHASTRR